MPEQSPHDLIEAYRKNRLQRSPLSVGDVLLILVVLLVLGVVGVVAVFGAPDFLQMNMQVPEFLLASPTPTATLTATITPTLTQTATLPPTATQTFTPTATPLVSPTPTQTVTPIPSVTPTESPIPLVEYVVGQGETLSDISARFGVSISQILLLNNLQPNALIFPGQVLKLPGEGATPLPEPSPTSSGTILYVVRAGDTLGGIADAFGVPARQVELLNNLQPDTFIFTGQQLLIPAPGSTPIPEP